MSYNWIMDPIKNLNKEQMLKALMALDQYLSAPLTLIVGGGSAMILAHQFPLATTDIDAIPKGLEINELDRLVKMVAHDLNLPIDWLNTYYSTFTYTLPIDYSTRLEPVFKGTHISALALGKSDMLIMKCYAHRSKDVAHAKALVKSGADTDFVEKHIQKLLEKRIPKSQQALDFFNDILDQMG